MENKGFDSDVFILKSSMKNAVGLDSRDGIGCE